MCVGGAGGGGSTRASLYRHIQQDFNNFEVFKSCLKDYFLQSQMWFR